MTKYELIKILEPFTDKTPIMILDNIKQYKFFPRIFLKLDLINGSYIILNNRDLKAEYDSKLIELK